MKATDPTEHQREPHFGFGWVWHQRTRPKVHAFRYRAFFVSVPATVLFGAPQGNWLFGVNRPALISVSAKDHGLHANDLLPGWINQAFVSESPRLICFARILGYQFKPVSFWVSPRKCLAEVHNTFSERHAYLFDRQSSTSIEKQFHVSPFCEIKGSYDFLIEEGNESFSAEVNYRDTAQQEPLIRTKIAGHLQPVNFKSSMRALLAYPLFSLMVMLRIHWQALRLWIKKVPFVAKPTPPSLSTHLNLSPRIKK